MENDLKARREALGLSQDAVADIFKGKYGKSTIKRQVISSWERGENTPNLENAFILAEIYKCSLYDLFALE